MPGRDLGEVALLGQRPQFERRIRPATVYPLRSHNGYSVRVKSRRVLLSNSVALKTTHL